MKNSSNRRKSDWTIVIWRIIKNLLWRQKKVAKVPQLNSELRDLAENQDFVVIQQDPMLLMSLSSPDFAHVQFSAALRSRDTEMWSRMSNHSWPHFRVNFSACHRYEAGEQQALCQGRSPMLLGSHLFLDGHGVWQAPKMLTFVIDVPGTRSSIPGARSSLGQGAKTQRGILGHHCPDISKERWEAKCDTCHVGQHA